MVDLRATTATGGETTLGELAVREFRENLLGEVLCPDDAGYEDARKVWNGMIDKRPGLIARCRGVADVIDAVSFARANDLLVAVRGGGHNVAGHAVCDGGILIDLSPMKGIRVDPAGRSVRAEAGVTWGEFDRETQAFGLAATGGVVSTTGIAGLTLGGGFGWLMRKFGLSCDSLVSVDMVTADGRFLRAGEDENPDLFWGVRGGGGNFGIITSFEYRLQPLGPVLAGRVIYPMAQAKDVLRFYREYTSTAPDELTTFVGLLTAPDGTPAVAVLVCYAGDIDVGEKVIKPLRQFGRPVADMVGPMTYRQHQSSGNAMLGPGLYNYWKSNFLKGLSDDAIDTLVEGFRGVPSPMTLTLIEHLGGAVSRVDEDATAFSHRNVPYDFLTMSVWRDPGQSEANVRWTRQLWDSMQPFSSGGVYSNYLGNEADEGSHRVEAAYGGAARYERLVALKNRYDPTNLFRLNQNITPTV